MQKYIKSLKGHSGCKIELIHNGKDIIVRKTSGSIDYNIRLKKQCVKQKIFSLQNIRTPKIYNYGKNEENLFYFDMEFVSGKTFAEYLPQLSTSEIKNYVECIFDNIFMQPIEKFFPASNAFMNKINILEANLTNQKNLSEAFELLKKYDWSLINKSFCHGDLTLENILITYDKKIYLIDFLDSFYNSWMIDIAKILQDVDLKWSYRNEKLTTNHALRLEIAKMTLIDKILNMKNGQEILSSIYHILLLNIIRIYPYTKDEVTFLYLDNAIDKLSINISNIKKGRLI